MVLPLYGAAPSLADSKAIVTALTSMNQAGYISGLTAHAGGTQAAGLPLSQTAPLVQVDTVATNGDSVLLPPAIPGAIMHVYNSGVATLDVYGLLTTDTINDSLAAFTMAASTAAIFFCAKTGSWAAR